MVLIDKEKCIGCGQCLNDCFPKAIEIKDKKAEVFMSRCMLCGHCVAVCPKNAVSFSDFDSDEIVEADSVTGKIDPKDYLNHLKLRRSIRRFSDAPVSDEEISKIIEVGRFSPTGGNIQDVSYYISQKEIAKLKSLVHEELAVLAGKLDPNDRAVAAYAKMWKNMSENFAVTGEDRLFFNAPVVIIISAFSPQSALIAAAHMETMIYSMGLGMLYSGFTTRAINYSDKLKKYIQLKDKKEVYATLVIGRPDVKYVRSVPRKDADIIWE